MTFSILGRDTCLFCLLFSSTVRRSTIQIYSAVVCNLHTASAGSPTGPAKAVHKMVLQIVKNDDQNCTESYSKVAQKYLKVAQKVLQNLNVPFHIYYKKLLITKEPFFTVPSFLSF